jgi:TolA-binding protein
MEVDATAWHLDKRIPIALIVSLIIQTGVATWWMADLSARVDTATTDNIAQDVRITAVERLANSQEVAAATIVANINAMRESITELKAEQSETNALLRQFLTGGQRP